MSRKPRQKPVKTASGTAAETPLAEAAPADQSDETATAKEAGSGNPMRDAFARMQELLSERIDSTRSKLRSNEAAFSRLAEYEAKIERLEAEITELRQSEKALQIHANQMSAENAVFRNRIETLQLTVVEVAMLRQVIQRVNRVAGEEVGRIVKALLPKKKGGLINRDMPVGEQAELLVATGVVDPEWYLKRHPDVAAAGMEAAVHYVLHGAEEGRQPGPALDRATEEK
ncbi:MAG: hypothetical protein ACSHXI_08925 [Hoeflea sp.]|uniref:hypothetical protein n=1 Tax=Hoeflea sp. TaxID=1940281 RepID=UPI003EF794EA